EVDPETGKKVRYFEHPRRVALILIDEVRCADPVMIMASLIHDCIEDTDIITPELIEHTLGTECARIVKMLSKVPKEGYLDRLMAYADWRVLVIKACDRLDNLRSLGSGNVEFQKKQIMETEEKYYPVFDLMVRLTPKAHVKCVKRLRDEIKSIVDRYKTSFKAAERPEAAAAKPARRKRR
ncbi:MAG TPA: HD domain-containing protein, partial [Patescibacteria group bacterium]|nr:HD domain-containing protein [Patescibacteria group bacterium]